MTNFDSAVGATEAALNSEGSAMEENNKRMDSLNGKLTQLKSAWQELARDTVNSNFVKNILSAITAIIKLTDKLGGLVPILTTVAGFFLVSKAGSLAKGVADFKTKITSFNKTISDLGGGLKALQLYLAGVTKAEDAAKIATVSFTTALQTSATVVGFAISAFSIGIQIGNAIKSSQEAQRQAHADTAESIIEETNKRRRIT